MIVVMMMIVVTMMREARFNSRFEIAMTATTSLSEMQPRREY